MRTLKHSGLALLPLVLFGGAVACAWEALPVADDPLVRMPGTQTGDAEMDSSDSCLVCHDRANASARIGHAWKGGMMGQAARDFIFLAAMTVAAQDSIWGLGNPNAADLCERCHFPEGWAEGRSDPVNASSMTGSDWDGIHCVVCHSMWDPFFESVHAGERPGMSETPWDESNASATPSQDAADATYTEDALLALDVALFGGGAFFGEDLLPFRVDYTENGGGQFFLSNSVSRRGPFADAAVFHGIAYSRYHKSKFFCGTCHDVSNPALANLEADSEAALPSEAMSAFSYFHVERTFSEFMLSAYGQEGGSAGLGPYAADQIETVWPGNEIGRCQDCHMQGVKASAAAGGLVRPEESVEHPSSAMPSHDMAGGNLFVSYVLASTVEGSSNYDAANASLLRQGAEVLTMDPDAGMGLDAQALLDYAAGAQSMLEKAAAIEAAEYDAETGHLAFRIQNYTGHKLISGFPEGRRMFVNIRLWQGGQLLHEVNPYDEEIATLKGLSWPASTSSPVLGENESYEEALVYETHPSSSLTGEQETFHFVLATHRYKDNRIPPKGFLIEEAPDRLAEPVWHGEAAPDYFSEAEYAGGYDAVELLLPAGADRVELRLYYQTTSREYMEFLRDEINGDADSLFTPAPSGEAAAYVAGTDPFFDGLRAWGDTVWQLWEHNKGVPGAAPVLMAEQVLEVDTEKPGAFLGCGAASGRKGSPVATLLGMLTVLLLIRRWAYR